VIGRKSSLILAFRLLSQVLGFVGLFFITRYLPVDVYGSVVWTLAFVATFNCISDLGFASAHIKRVSEGKDIDDCVSTYLFVRLILTGVMVAVVLGSVFVWTALLGNQFYDTTIWLLLIMVGYYVLYDVANIAINTFDARLETSKSQIIIIMDPLIRTPLIIIVALGRGDAVALASAYLIGAAALMLVALLFFLRQRFKIRKPKLLRSYYQFAAPTAISIVLGAVLLNVDKLVVGFFGNSNDVAYLSSSQSIMLMFSVVTAALATTIFPAFSRLYHENKIDEVRQKTHEGERYLSLILVPIVIILVVFPTAVATVLLGEKFSSAGPVLQVLALALYLSVLNLTYGYQIAASNHPEVNAKMTVLTLVIFIVALLILVPDSLFKVSMLGLSYYGAALASLIVGAIMFVVTRMVVKKLTGTGSNIRILLHVSAGVLAGMALYALSFVIPVERWYDLVLYGLLSIGLFLGILAAMREFSKADLRYFIGLAHPKELLSTLKADLKPKK
jgi:O-antigen/teichoic acid export membrane protein